MASTPQQFTETDEVHARLLGILICSAKFVQSCAADCQAGKPPTGEHVRALVHTVLTLSHVDGFQLERDVLELAKHLGFVIQQQYIPTAGGVN